MHGQCTPLPVYTIAMEKAEKLKGSFFFIHIWCCGLHLDVPSPLLNSFFELAAVSCYRPDSNSDSSVSVRRLSAAALM